MGETLLSKSGSKQIEISLKLGGHKVTPISRSGQYPRRAHNANREFKIYDARAAKTSQIMHI